MNKQCYSLIYSRTHGELRVVSELARSCSTAPGQRRGTGGSRLWVTVRRAVWLLGAALFAGQALADGIIADRQAASAQRPEVITTQNGLPQVNINAPNQAGISHNPYQQFDVDKRGAILNNSAVMTSTQLAGMIQGNPRLDPNKAPARFIINEVNSDKPSQLQGFLEVAGGRAQVIVANPSGIVCNGCGTINAGRMTLTTGKPQLNADGSLAGYQVERGMVSIEGGGLNGDPRHDTGYVDILARAVKVNAGIWAKEELAVVAGRNHISSDGKTVTPLSPDSKAPELAIDMGQMGGMYSGHIRMIGTEAGVGVRNKGGHLQAGKTLTVSSEGKLSWQSNTQQAVTQAGGNINIAARDDIEHHGKLHSGEQLTIQSRQGSVKQSGTLAAAGDIQLTSARDIQSSGHLLAGSDINSTLTHEANLTLTSQGNIQASGSLLSKRDVNLTGQRVDISQSRLASDRAVITAQAGGVGLRQTKVDSRHFAVKTKGNIEALQAEVRAGRWNIDGNNLFNKKSVWSQVDAGESRFALTGALDNTEGTIEAKQLSFNVGSLNNQQGQLVALDNTEQHWQVKEQLNNTDGTVGSNGSLQLDVGRLNNQHGTLKSQSDLHVESRGDIKNSSEGKLLSGKTLTLKASGSVDNQSGEIKGEHLAMTAQRLNNTKGKAISKGRLMLDSQQQVDNQYGLLEAGDALDIRTKGKLDNRSGIAQGGKQIDIFARHIDNSAGKVLAEHTLTVNAGDSINNQRGTLQSQSALHVTSGADIQNGQGKLLAVKELTLKAGGKVDNQSGNIQGEHLQLTAQSLNNTKGKAVSKGRLQLDSRQQVDNQHGLIQTDDVLDISTDGKWDNRSGTTQGGKQVKISASHIDNSDGKLSAGQLLTLHASDSIENRSGDIQGENLQLTAPRLDNTKGKIVSKGHLLLDNHQAIDNQFGLLEAGGALDIRTKGKLDNRSGIAQGGKQVDISVHHIDNSVGKVLAEHTLTVNAGDSINNQRGTLQSQSALHVTSGADLQNGQGKLLAVKELTLKAGGKADNQSGNIQGEHLQLTVQSLNNTKGKAVSKGRLQLDSRQQVDNQHGLIQTDDVLDISTDGKWDNRSGTTQGGKQVKISASHIDNSDGKLSAGQLLTLHASDSIENRSGDIQGESLQLTAPRLDNTKGKIVSKGHLLLDNHQAIDNQHGLLEAGDALDIRTKGKLDNRSGIAQGGKQVDISAHHIDNSDGQVLAEHALTVNAGDSINNQRGTLQSQSALHVTLGADIQNGQGKLLAVKELTLKAGGKVDNQSGDIQGENLKMTAQNLNNTKGNIVSTGHFELDMEKGIENQNGLIEAANTLDIRTRSNWDNHNGIAQGGKKVIVSAHHLDNTAGKLQSGGDLTLKSLGKVINQSGTLTAKKGLSWQGEADSSLNNDAGWLFSEGVMSLKGGQLTNRQKGEILGKQGLTLDLTGSWDNQSGKIASNGHTKISALELLNSQGEIQVLNSLDMQFTQALNNNKGHIFSKLAQSLRAKNILNSQGWIGSQSSWSASGEQFDNSKGSVLSLHDATLTVSTLDNQKGTLQSAKALKLSVTQDIDNQAGKISAQGRLDVHGTTEDIAAGKLNNAGGQLLTGGDLIVKAKSLNNTSGGLIDSQKKIQLTLSEALDNHKGKLRSSEGMQLNAQSLANKMGSIDSKQQLGLSIVGLLNNIQGTVRSNGDQSISAGQINNQKGVFSSQGKLDLTTVQFDNPEGTVISQGNGSYRINELNNKKGKIHSGGTLTFNGKQIHNQAGELISTGDMWLDSTQLNNNEKGKITSQNALVVQSDQLNNSQGGLLLGTTRTEVTASKLDNTQGRLQSAGTLTLSNLTRLNNQQGYILANKSLDINTGTSSMLALLNQRGLVQSGNQLTANTLSMNNEGGTLLSQKGLTLTVQQDYTHRVGDTLSSNGALIFSVGGKLTNEADWLLPGNLTVNSTHFTNVGTLVGKVLKLTTGTLLNQNRLEADSMTLTSDKLDNTNTIMSDGITVRSRLIDNHGKDAVIAATERMDLHAGEHLINRDGSLIYSAGNLYLSSDDLIENRASRIEADGDGWVTAKRLNNLREGLKIEREAEKNDIKWHGYNYYWRSYGGGMNFDPTTIAPTTQRLTFNDDTAVENNIYGTLSDIDAANKRAQVRVKDNKGQLRKLWVNYLALTPSHDGSYDMTFYETRGHRQGMSFILMKIYPPTPYHNTIWREHNRGRIEQWDPKEHLDIANIPFVNDYNNFRERSSTGTVTRDKLVSEGIAAHILAGGKMVLNITDELLNDASTVSANGDLSVKGDGKITNKGYSVNERRQELLVDHYDQDARHWYPTHNTDETTALATIDAIISGNGNVTIGGAHLENTTVNQAQISVVEAAQKAAEAERVEWERNPLAVTVDDVTWQAKDAKLESLKELLTPLKRKLTSTDQSSISDDQLLTLLKRTLTSVDQPLISDDQLLSLFKRELTSVDKPLTPAELALTNKQRLDKVGTSVPNNGLFRQHPAEGSPYLVVTDERFTSRTRFISSDYLLQQVKYDPAQVHKRLGDGFYEQRLVREQMLKLTGRPSVRGEDAMAQYQALMNNGASVAQDFHLVPGVALTPAQIAALQQDIVWLVSETVDTATGPQTVWVPKVYLANTTLRLTGDGALIAGGNLQLSANSLNNSGNLFADRALNIDASQFLHQSGEIRADSIDVQADSLKMSTNLQDALRQASMSARELSLKGGDIQLQGAKLNAKQNLNLHARNNLDITAAKSSKTGSFEVISGAMGNRTSDGIEEAGKRMAQVSGEWQQALGSTLNAGGNLNLTAGQDITLKGSQVKAEGSARLQAGGNVNLLAETTTNNTHLEANSNTSSVSNSREEERLHLSTLSGGKGVAIQAGKNLTAEGAQVDSQYGSIGLSAQSVTIKDARQRVADQDSESKREGSKKSQREMETVSNNVVGSTFSGRDGISITASEGDITVTGSTLHSEQGELTLQAKKDITLNSATESDYLFSESRSEKRGFLSTSKTHTVQKDHVTREKGTLLSGDSISITAGNDLAVSGSAIVGDKDVTLQAGNNVDITAATETQTHYLLEEQKKSGLLSSGGIGFTVGSKSTRHEVNENGTTQSQSVSTVGSNQGDVSITAGNQVHVSGADLVASKDLSITGDSVQIDPGYDKRTREETFESKQSGLTLALSGSVGSALNTAVSTAQQARKESDGRLKALKGTQAALSGAQSYQAYQLSEANSAKADAINQAGGDAKKPDDVIGIQLSYGSQASKSDTRVDTTDSQGSNLNAGRDIRIIATGDKAEKNSGNIHIQGSGLKAGHDVALDAKQDIVLESAENTQTTRGKNSSQGGSVGVGLTAGQGGYGIKFSASVNKGKGHETGDGVTHTETLIDAGNQVSLKSGQDTTLKGAQVSGEKVTAEVGRNLHLQSEQDKDNYDSKQENISAGASFTYGSMNGSASVNASRDKMHSKFESVNEQTGIFAGKGGFDVKVGEHTQLDGAVIASTAEKEKNRLETGTLGFSDIDNKAEFKTEHQSAGFSTSGSMGSQIGNQLATNMASNMLGGTNKDENKSSTTHAAVGDGTLIIRDMDKQQQDVATLSRDTENAANSLTPIFDKEKERQRLAQAQAIAEIGNQAMDIYNTQEAITATKTATEAMKDPQQQQALKEKAQAQLKKENKEINAKTVADRAYDIAYDRALENQGAAIGGERRQAVTAVVTALQGLAGGDIKAAIASGAAPYLANAVKGLTYGNKTEYSQLTPEEKATNLLAHAILGGVIAEMKGGSATGGAVGAVGGELAASAIAGALYSGKSIEELSPDEKEKVSNLSTLAGGIAAGLATNSTAGGVDGAQTAKNAVENNFLTAKQIDGFAAKAKGCEARGDCQQINQEMRDLSLKQQEEIIAVCASNPAACKEKYGDIPANGLLVRQAIDRVLGADVPSQMKNDMSSLLAQQIEAEGVVSSTEFAHQLISRYGIDKQQAEILAGAALGAVTGGMGNKGSKPSTVATDNKGSNWSAGKGQYSTKDQGTVTTVEHPKGKHDGKSLPYFEIKSLPDIHGKGHITAVKGDAKIPVDKVELYMRGKAAGDLDALKKEYNSLKDLRIQNQREFAKNPENKTNLSILEKKIHNVERSQEMNRVLNDAGLPDTKTNNNMIIGKLLDSAKNVTPENRKTSVVVSGNNGSVRVYATWTILPDGSKRLATVQTGTFK